MSDSQPDDNMPGPVAEAGPSEADVQGFLEGLDEVKPPVDVDVKAPIPKVTGKPGATKAQLATDINRLQEERGIPPTKHSTLMHRTKAQLEQELAKLIEGAAKQAETKRIIAGLKEPADDDESSSGGYEVSEMSEYGDTPEPVDISCSCAARSLFRMNLIVAKLVAGLTEQNKDTLGVSIADYPKQLEDRQRELEELYTQIYLARKDQLEKYLTPEFQIAMINASAAFQSIKTT